MSLTESNPATVDPADHQLSIHCPGLPLAVYREVLAHVRQVEGVEGTLVPQQSHQFEYRQSQIGALEIRFGAQASQASRARVQQILAYYADRFGAWQPCTSTEEASQ